MCPPLTAQLARYQEQPHLLDPHLGAIVGTLMGAVRTPLRAWHARRVAEAEAAAAAGLLHAFPLQLHTNRHVHACFRVLYALCKTRGAKTVAKFLPHEVADLEPAAQSLTCQVRRRAQLGGGGPRCRQRSARARQARTTLHRACITHLTESAPAIPSLPPSSRVW